jgi:hypothetical protein
MRLFFGHRFAGLSQVSNDCFDHEFDLPQRGLLAIAIAAREGNSATRATNI